MNSQGAKILTITSNDLGISWGPAIHYLELWNEYSALLGAPSVVGLAPSWTGNEPIIAPKFNLKQVKVPNIGKFRQIIFDFVAFWYLVIFGRQFQLIYVRASHWHLLQILYLKLSGKQFLIELNGLAKDDSISARKINWVMHLVCWQERWFCENANQIICVSNGIERTVRREYAVKGKTITIRNGVASQFFLSGRMTVSEVKTIIYVGTFTPWDGAEKIKDIAVAHPEIDFLMVGDGPGRVSVQKGAPSNMTFTGMVNYADLPNLYASADAAIVIYEFERHRNVELSSIKTLEYLASRLPVFSTDVPGQGVINNLGFGYLVREGESLIGGFERFLSRFSDYKETLLRAEGLESTIGWRRTAMETLESMK